MDDFYPEDAYDPYDMRYDLMTDEDWVEYDRANEAWHAEQIMVEDISAVFGEEILDSEPPF